MIPNIPFLISTTSTGKINFIACPPLLYKYSIVESFINYDSEDTGEPLGNFILLKILLYFYIYIIIKLY